MSVSENYGGLFVMKKNVGKIIAVILVVALLSAVLAACVPSDFSKAKENLEKNGYVATVVENGSIANAANAAAVLAATAFGVTLTGKCDAVVTGTNGDNGVTIYYFDNTTDAKAFNKVYKEKTKAAKEELKKAKDNGDITEEEYKESLEDMKNFKFGVSGKAFYFGTKEAVKACN